MENCIQPVSDDDVDWAKMQCRTSSRSGSTDFDQQAKNIYDAHNWSDAISWQDALEKYVTLLRNTA